HPELRPANRPSHQREKSTPKAAHVAAHIDIPIPSMTAPQYHNLLQYLGTSHAPKDDKTSTANSWCYRLLPSYRTYPLSASITLASQES
ncbi:hypothetical protein LINPERHAP1_LOCUS34404, partial [Linum perenne]